jgi:uncharacterized protein YndB with AHSA1/START domain
MTSSLEVSVDVVAPPAVVYRALLDPDAVARWRVPDNMTSEVHEWQARPGGRFRVSLTYVDDEAGKSGGRTDTYHGRFDRLVPDELVVEVVEFETEDPALQGEMTIITILTPTAEGCTVTLRHDGVPEGVRPDENDLGTRMSLAKLAALVTRRG